MIFKLFCKHFGQTGQTWGLEETMGFLTVFPFAGLLSSFLWSTGLLRSGGGGGLDVWDLCPLGMELLETGGGITFGLLTIVGVFEETGFGKGRPGPLPSFLPTCFLESNDVEANLVVMLGLWLCWPSFGLGWFDVGKGFGFLSSCWPLTTFLLLVVGCLCDVWYSSAYKDHAITILIYISYNINKQKTVQY